MKIVIKGSLPGLNEYINAERANRYLAASIKRKAEDYIQKFIPPQKLKKAVRITYAWFAPNKRKDKDNIAFAKKFINDALVRSGVIPNDGWDDIDSFADEFAVDAKNPRIEVTVTEVT